MVISMKAIESSFKLFIRQIYSDAMLAAITCAPPLMGFALKYALPLALQKLGCMEVYCTYGLLADIFMCIMTSYLMCFTSALVIMGEMDENVSVQLITTPLGRRGYLTSRLTLPALAAFVYSTLILLLFSVSGLSFASCVIYSLLSALLSIISALLMVVLAKNKVEGMAIGKLSGALIMGAAIPFFSTRSARYLCAFLPSFWLGEYALDPVLHKLAAYVLVLAVWYAALISCFNKKVR